MQKTIASNVSDFGKTLGWTHLQLGPVRRPDMDTQTARRRNLSRILSRLELAGLLTPEAQAAALGNIVTPRRLLRLVMGSRIDTDVARAIEHRFDLPRSALDRAPEDPRCGIGAGREPSHVPVDPSGYRPELPASHLRSPLFK